MLETFLMRYSILEELSFKSIIIFTWLLTGREYKLNSVTGKNPHHVPHCRWRAERVYHGRSLLK